MRITFTNSHGDMTITAGKGFERSYTWAGGTRSLVMWPRKERWYGSLGMYNPGSYIEGELEQWKEHDGIKRCVAAEGQRHFTNTTEAIQWVQKSSQRLDYIYNDGGLVVGMDKHIQGLAHHGLRLIQRGEYTGGRYAYADAQTQLGTVIELLEND